MENSNGRRGWDSIEVYGDRAGVGGFCKMMLGPSLGVPIIRNIVYWGLHIFEPPIGNSQVPISRIAG